MEVYEPREDSALLVEAVNELTIKDLKALDMGCGSGVILEALSKKTKNLTGADINPFAVEQCKKKYKKIKFIQSNLFANIKDKYDLITFNPPYLPEEEKEDLETALMNNGGKQGYELLIKFLTQAKTHLTKNGMILTVFSTLTKPDIVFSEAKKLGYKHEIIRTKKLFFEELFVAKFTPD